MGTVRYVGVKVLKGDGALLKTLVENYVERLDRDLKKYSLVFQTKIGHVKGKKQYTFHCRLIASGFTLQADAIDWDLRRTVHKTMQKIENGVKKSFRTEGQPQERFHPSKAKKGTDTRVKQRLRRKGWRWIWPLNK